MLKEYLDAETYGLITKYFNFSDITEIRMRINQKIIVCVRNKKFYLKNNEQQFVVYYGEAYSRKHSSMLLDFIHKYPQKKSDKETIKKLLKG